MLTKRIIPCLDIQNGRAVKGVCFKDLKDAGDPVTLAQKYAQLGADELVFLDISATEQRRKTLIPLVRDIAEVIAIPFTVGGGISSLEDAKNLLNNGADKIAINSAAIRNPLLITTLAKELGSQCVVVAIDAKIIDNHWKVHLVGGKVATNLDVFDWAKEAQDRGAGEILFTSMDHDGAKAGFANKALSKMAEFLTIPIIASGGAGTMQHFSDAFTIGKADAALAASVFHFEEIQLPELKQFLKAKQLPIRI